jgi:glutamate/tyrosine decarboxylase-like PLP-dependent enzyme
MSVHAVGAIGTGGGRRATLTLVGALDDQGRDVDDVIAELRAKRADDVRWSDGRTFGLVYDGGASVHEVAERAARLYLHDNALNTQAFPSLGQIQREVVGWTAGLLHGDDGVAGFLTSGGTESILCAVLAARERAAAERGVDQPEIVLAESAHAAFHKAAHNFGLVVRKAPVRDDWTADVEAMAELVGPDTALVVGSAPQYPQGVQDDIPAIAALAAAVGANCHVDACMGGFVLPFAERLGREVLPWDFRVDGVTTISADVHKLGYAPKGVSVILHRTKALRRYQTFVFDGWLGGFYASPNMQGTRSGLPMACAWAVMAHLGVEGYVELTRWTLENADRMRAGIAAIDGVRVLGGGRFHLVAMAADPAATREVDVFALGDALAARGWYHDRQGPPDSLHSTVSNTNAGVIDSYLADLATCVGEVAGARTDDRSTTYATLE